MSKIKSLFAREIIDSRGVPTVEVEIELTSRQLIIASVPSGASTGKLEALELRDNNMDNYCGKSVNQAVLNINKEICIYIFFFIFLHLRINLCFLLFF